MTALPSRRHRYGHGACKEQLSERSSSFIIKEINPERYNDLQQFRLSINQTEAIPGVDSHGLLDDETVVSREPRAGGQALLQSERTHGDF